MIVSTVVQRKVYRQNLEAAVSVPPYWVGAASASAPRGLHVEAPVVLVPSVSVLRLLAVVHFHLVRATLVAGNSTLPRYVRAFTQASLPSFLLVAKPSLTSLIPCPDLAIMPFPIEGRRKKEQEHA